MEVCLEKYFIVNKCLQAPFSFLGFLGFQGHAFCTNFCNQTCIVLEDLYAMSNN
jgi:hypothetical protein